MNDGVDVAIVGAGPYGLSIGAHLHAFRREFRIFGNPMQTWRERMPDGMLLKSDGFASNLSDPNREFTLARYCESMGIPYHDTQVPVALDSFRAYGLAFQQRMVPELENTEVVRVESDARGFRLRLANGGEAKARRVVLAVGITHFSNMPSELAGLPADLVTHSSAHRDPTRLRGRRVAVLGGGASAVDLAVLLREAGADVTLVARRAALRFADPPSQHGRSLRERLRHPSSPIGPGLRSRIYSDAPWLVRLLPRGPRLRLIAGHLGPAAGWPMKARFHNVPLLLQHRLRAAVSSGGRLQVTFSSPTGHVQREVDHLVAATGYKVDLSRLAFLDEALRARIHLIQNAPVLSSSLESTVPGLYFVGASSASTFGPLMRFACGADWTARRIVRALYPTGLRTAVPLASEPRHQESSG